MGWHDGSGGLLRVGGNEIREGECREWARKRRGGVRRRSSLALENHTVQGLMARWIAACWGTGWDKPKIG